MPADHDMIDVAIGQAHLPSLIVTLAHLTDRMDLLRDAWRPRYLPYTDQRDGGLSTEEQAEVAAMARELLPQYLRERPSPEAACPSQATLVRLMNFLAGVEIPERYLALLKEELGLGRRERLRGCSGPARFRVLVIGAGMSGLLAGVKLKEAGYQFDIIERGSDVGGTWHANTYPGCRVDSQNHLYSFSFFPNHDWPHGYSTQEALKAYFRKAADHFALWDHIRLDTIVTDLRFDPAIGQWRVRLCGSGGREETVTANAVISAVGQLNTPHIPLIAGQDLFEGPQFHSGAWRHDVDLKGKAVAVVGTGASAFQLIPEVASRARRLTVYQRTAPWVSPTPDYHAAVGEGQKLLFRALPFYANWYRFWLFWMMTEGVMPALKVDPAWKADDGSVSAANQRIRNALVDHMRRQVGDRSDLLDKVIPKSPFGGKRTLRDDGRWIDCLKRDNVELVVEKIQEITPQAIVTEDGRARAADAIIYGTGFQANRFLQSAQVWGSDGVELNETWCGDPRAYLGITIPGFPNFFCVYGPSTNLVAQGSIVFMSECAVRYIIGALDLLRRRNAAALEPKEDVTRAYVSWVDGENARMAWGMAGVTNWYKSATGRVSQNWPFPLADYWKLTRAPNPEDLIFTPGPLAVCDNARVEA